MKMFSLVSMVLGCFLGAGFVSGREVASYFSLFGFNSIFGIILATFLLFVLIVLFFLLSYIADSFSKFINIYFGKGGCIINFLFAVSLLILISSMFAGAISLADTLNINKFLLLIITGISVYLVAIGNVKVLSRINNIVMPILILTLLVVTICNNYCLEQTNNNILLSLVSGSNYVFINIVTLGLFILEIGKHYTLKQKILGSLVSSLIIGVLLYLSNNAIIQYGLVDASMPLLELALQKNELLGKITSVAIWVGLFTTLVSCVVILSKYINKFVNNIMLSLVIAIISGIIFSNVGFGVIVSYVYSVIGLIGLVVVIRVIAKEKETRITSFLYVKN